jgi:hypothetical protein
MAEKGPQDGLSAAKSILRELNRTLSFLMYKPRLDAMGFAALSTSYGFLVDYLWQHF